VERDDLQRPVVYHLLGRLSASPTYVISDEDVLEFICALQSEHLTPEKLFHALEHSHLLVIGSDFSNWLARLFLRMTKRRRLSDPRDVGEILADNHSLKDVRLVSFLQQVSVRTRMFSGAEEFVAELHRRWLARRSGSATATTGSAAPLRFPPPAREMPENAVFISYAREDLPAVQQLKAALDAAGITTWFDMDRLESGDDYDRKIRGNIARCSFFVPVVSATTQRRHEGYFRREWSYAVDRTRGMADGAVFVLPVCIDGTAEADAIVPEKFKAVHFSRVPGGEPPPEFTRRLQDLFSAKARYRALAQRLTFNAQLLTLSGRTEIQPGGATVGICRAGDPGDGSDESFVRRDLRGRPIVALCNFALRPSRGGGGSGIA
jgi:hypothetical protein